ncbi:hypothetical protein ROHU_009390 [Labeo rohita]|uniref:Uncharacterized protein n=1 Tax=Labeo rohita TaxID=84645 RepID=A0A498L6G0_LABRO|nr:hypothetical protein ROHU_034340 [Labeo rohita]RXN13874.1 hypothetical protein ROHU_009390 [Labeo rohita]
MCQQFRTGEKTLVVLAPVMAPPSVVRDGETLNVSNIKSAAAVRSKDGKEGQQKAQPGLGRMFLATMFVCNTNRLPWWALLST